MPAEKKISGSELRTLLTKTHKTIESHRRTEIFFNALFVLLLWVICLLLIEQHYFMPPFLKALFLLGTLAIALGSIFLGRRRITPTSFMEFYRAFSRSAGIPELTYALDLEKNSSGNPRLVEAAIFKNLELVDPEILNTKLDQFLFTHPATTRFKNRRLFSFLLLLLTIITTYSFSDSGLRLARFWESFQKPNPYFFTVSPGTQTLEQGSEFVVDVQFRGEIPDELSLFLKTPVEESYRQRGMDGLGSSFSSSPIELNTNLSYYLEMDGFTSDLFQVEVQLRPRLSSLHAQIIPPTYTRLDTSTVTYPFAQIEAPQGSEIIISGQVNKPVAEFLVETREFQQDVFVNDDLGFEYRFTAKNADTVQFHLSDTNELTNRNKFRFTISPLADNLPYVELVEPSASYEEVEPTEVKLLFRANDDYALTKANLHYELSKAFVNTPKTGSIKLKRPQTGVIQSFMWDVSDLNLKPKDALTFWIEVTDNDGYNGPKSSTSDRITLTVPSLNDYFDDIGEQEDNVESDLEDISESFSEMQEQYDLFKEQLKETPDQINYEQQRQLQEVQKQQEEIEQRIEELNEAFKEIKDELSESSMLSEETMEAYEELQKLMEEIDDPAFKEALQKLQDQMRGMSPEQLREALEQAEFNEELYKERIERTLELFKQLKLNSDLEKLAQTYEDIAREEETPTQENSPSSMENDDMQANLKQEAETRKQRLEELNQLRDKLDDLSDNASPKNEETISELQEKSQAELDDIENNIKKMLEDLEKALEKGMEAGDPPMSQQEYQKQKQQIAEKMKKMAEQTRSAMEEMANKQMNINIAGLQYILYSLLNLSIEQEDLVSYALATETRSPAYIEYARDQKNVEDIFKTLADSLFQLSTEIPQFSNQINEKKLEVEKQLIRSLEQMAERNQAQATITTRQALGGINEIAYLLANLLEQLQNQSNGDGGGGGMSTQQMMQQMQQMGQEQQQINEQIQNMINDIQGNRLTQDQMERLNQLSKQQNRIRQQLQNMQRNGQLEGGDKLGSELERMIEQMEETINDLRGGAVDPTLIERQQNILSRMLEAEQAMQERDEEEKREGTTATDTPPGTPPEMTLEELEQEIRNRLNDPNFTKYSADYQRLIEKYFELLKARQIQ